MCSSTKFTPTNCLPVYELEEYNEEWKRNIDGILVLNIITLVLVLVPIITNNNTLLKFWSITSLTFVLICANIQIKTHQTYCWTRGFGVNIDGNNSFFNPDIMDMYRICSRYVPVFVDQHVWLHLYYW